MAQWGTATACSPGRAACARSAPTRTAPRMRLAGARFKRIDAVSAGRTPCLVVTAYQARRDIGHALYRQLGGSSAADRRQSSESQPIQLSSTWWPASLRKAPMWKGDLSAHRCRRSCRRCRRNAHNAVPRPSRHPCKRRHRLCSTECAHSALRASRAAWESGEGRSCLHPRHHRSSPAARLLSFWLPSLLHSSDPCARPCGTQRRCSTSSPGLPSRPTQPGTPTLEARGLALACQPIQQPRGDPPGACRLGRA